MRWLYHVLVRADLDAGGDEVYAPASLSREGFVHASYAPLLVESAALYFARDADLVVLQIDPRALDGVRVDVASTPRGAMPHVEGAIPRAAIVAIRTLGEMATAPDDVDDGVV